MKFFSLLLISILLLSSLCAKAQMYSASPAEILQTIFAGASEIIEDKKVVTPDQLESISKKIKNPVTKTNWNFYIAKTKNQIVGYAVIDNELGKTDPITFLTAINPDGTVKDVELIAYREAYGGEVKSKKFLGQYIGKTNDSPIRVGQDIANITGATISSRAVTLGVKRDLAVWQAVYLSTPIPKQ